MKHLKRMMYGLLVAICIAILSGTIILMAHYPKIAIPIICGILIYSAGGYVSALKGEE